MKWIHNLFIKIINIYIEGSQHEGGDAVVVGEVDIDAVIDQQPAQNRIHRNIRKRDS